MRAHTLACRTLEANTNVVAWCSHPQLCHVLAVGTYQLDRPSGQRHGALEAYVWPCGDAEVKGDGGGQQAAPSSIPRATTRALPGVFEAEWSFGSDVIATALADGSVRLFRCSSEEAASPSVCFRDLARADLPSELSSDALTCCVSWDGPRSSLDAGPRPMQDRLAASYSCGGVAVFQATPAALAPTLCMPEAHSLEVWACAWHASSHASSTLLWTGADDGVLAAWDVRCDPGGFAAWKDSKSHGAGVTSIRPSPHRDWLVATGCYDETLRVWDLRHGARPVLAAAVETPGGGVWRVRWHPSDPGLLAAASMQAGQCAVRLEEAPGGKELVAGRVVCEYEHQKTLAYGIDWQRRAEGSLLASCSFYDNSLHLWSLSMD